VSFTKGYVGGGTRGVVGNRENLIVLGVVGMDVSDDDDCSSFLR
jgi:hypothetical protein